MTTRERTNAQLLERRNAAVPRGIASACPVFPDRAQNAEVWDVEGRRYLDFSTGIAVLNVGHLHPRVKDAVSRQLERFTHPCFQVLPYEPYVELAERLSALAPGDFRKKSIFLTTGAEAVENAVKIARSHTGRPGVISFTGGFHGRTLLTLALTGKVVPYKLGFGPFPGAVFHAPYPIAYWGIGTAESLRALDGVFKSDIAPSEVAAIIAEPVLGEGGFYAAPFDFLRALRDLCDEHGIVLIADEIQTGFARTGRMFGIEHSGVVPDLMTVAKSIAGGLPLAGVVGKAEIMDAPGPGGLGGTYGGNALACTAALAVLDVIEEEGLIARARAVGERVTARLRELADRPGLRCIGDVRGLGAMCAFELVEERDPPRPAPALAKALQARALENGLVLIGCGLHSNVIRLLPPLTISDALLDEGLDLLEASLEEVTRA